MCRRFKIKSMIVKGLLCAIGLFLIFWFSPESPLNKPPPKTTTNLTSQLRPREERTRQERVKEERLIEKFPWISSRKMRKPRSNVDLSSVCGYYPFRSIIPMFPILAEECAGFNRMTSAMNIEEESASFDRFKRIMRSTEAEIARAQQNVLPTLKSDLRNVCEASYKLLQLLDVADRGKQMREVCAALLFNTDISYSTIQSIFSRSNRASIELSGGHRFAYQRLKVLLEAEFRLAIIDIRPEPKLPDISRWLSQAIVKICEDETVVALLDSSKAYYFTEYTNAQMAYNIRELCNNAHSENGLFYFGLIANSMRVSRFLNREMDRSGNFEKEATWIQRFTNSSIPIFITYLNLRLPLKTLPYQTHPPINTPIGDILRYMRTPPPSHSHSDKSFTCLLCDETTCQGYNGPNCKQGHENTYCHECAWKIRNLNDPVCPFCKEPLPRDQAA